MYIIFTDVDGTMIDNNQKLLEQTVVDIKNAKKKGIKLAICTGNSHLTNMNELAKKIEADFLITSDGARIYDFKVKTLIYKKKINKKNANKFLETLKKWSNFITWTSEKGLFINVQNLTYKEAAIATNKKYHCKNELFKFTDKIQENIYKMTCFAPKKNLDLIIKKAEEYNINYLRHNDNFMSIAPKNYNKGEGIKRLCLLKKIDLDNIMTIGDGINDISMMKVTKNSYAMANAVKSIKDISNHHTSSVEQNGLGEAIIDFMFRKKI